jgi:glucokinase
MHAIGIDIGGTRIKAVLIDKDGNVLYHQYRATEDNADMSWRQTVVDIVLDIKARFTEYDLVLGISAPGLPNENNTAIAHMPGRMQGLENFNWQSNLKLPACVLNDAVAAMVAESRFGAARKKSNAVLVTLGTGVGGAILIDGKPYQGAFNKAGHIGHMVIDDEGDCDVTGMPGSLEECIGECTIVKRTGGKFNSTRDMLNAMRNGDEYAKAIWLKSVRQLAIGLSSITNVLSPETIVLGGGITEAGTDLFDPLNEYMARYEWRTGGNKAEIVKAVFGDLAGAVGAAFYAMRLCTKNEIHLN